MPHRLRITIRWSRPLRRSLAATLSGVVISIVSLLGEPPRSQATKRHVELHIELRSERAPSR